jgi:hypothetical protein
MSVLHAVELMVVGAVVGAVAGFLFKKYLINKAEALLIRVK